MNITFNAAIAAPLAVLAVFAAAPAQSAPTTIALPQETSNLKLSAMPGYVIATQQCAICHSADYIRFQPPGMSLAQWTGEAAKMKHAYGAPLSDDDVKLVGAYLAVNYGGAKEGELPAELRAPPPRRR